MNTRTHTPLNTRPWRLPVLGIVAAAALAACGGGGSSVAELSDAVAQGYAADASTMPTATFGALDAVGDSLDEALEASGVAAAQASDDARRQALAAVSPADVTTSVDCVGGGTVQWTVTGGTLETQLNRQLDTGENFDITYAQCVTREGVTLDGRAVVDVTLRSDAADDLAMTVDGLTATGVAGATFLLNGELRNERTRETQEGGGRSLTSRFTSNAFTLASTIGVRQANYTLQSLDWSVTRVRDAQGLLTARSHEGALSLAARTPRRPDATLDIATSGALQIADDGYAAAGGLTVSTNLNRWTVSWSLPSTVTIQFDAGNNGTVNRTWTLTRQGLLDQAG